MYVLCNGNRIYIMPLPPPPQTWPYYSIHLIKDNSCCKISTQNQFPKVKLIIDSQFLMYFSLTRFFNLFPNRAQYIHKYINIMFLLFLFCIG